ncbi:hypothetical protein L6164_037852 [Bauhinia variegata]|uniref:Uncharacterized protein n=1 Tax=Bauhinia variegata TaxID=167791 RepID=A0ACB9KL72_BAUVA|nr:hypothetical protein L6164_037852 [Bauhinia variegata]
MPVPKTDALPLGYTPYGLVLDGRTNEERGKGEAGLEERAVQERGDIATQVLSKETPCRSSTSFLQKERHKKKGLVAGTDGDEGYRADAAGYREPQGCKVPGKRPSLCL